MSKIVAAIVAAIAPAAREFTLTSYRIVAANTPVFNTPEGAFIAPDSETVKALASSEKEEDREKVIFKVEGTIFRTYGTLPEDASALGYKALPVTAEKYAHPSFSFKLAEDGTTVIVTLPIFKRGSAVKVRTVKADAPAMLGLLSIGRTPETVTVTEPTETVTETN